MAAGVAADAGHGHGPVGGGDGGHLVHYVYPEVDGTSSFFQLFRRRRKSLNKHSQGVYLEKLLKLLVSWNRVCAAVCALLTVLRSGWNGR
eukprot:COSAG04_NODE_260_length_18679_cov_4.566439_10_plen_90_part_00